MTRCAYPTGCDALAFRIAETPEYDVPLCEAHYEAMIESAQRSNPEFAPDVIRSCMERASYFAEPMKPDVIKNLPVPGGSGNVVIEPDGRDER